MRLSSRRTSKTFINNKAQECQEHKRHLNNSNMGMRLSSASTNSAISSIVMAPGRDPIWTGMLLWVVDLNMAPGPGMQYHPANATTNHNSNVSYASSPLAAQPHSASASPRGSAHSLRWRFSCCAFKYLRPIVTQQNQMDDTFAFGYDLDPNDTGDDKTPEVRLSVAYAKSQQGTLSPTAPSHALRLHVDIARAALPSPNTRCLLLSPRYDVESNIIQSIFNPSIPSMAYYRCCL